MVADVANLLLTRTDRVPNISDRSYDQLLSRTAKDLRSALSIKSGKRIEDAELLQVLHPTTNSLGYTFLLNHLNIDRTSDIYLIALVSYLTQFDAEQVRYAAPEFRRILEIAEDAVRKTNQLQLLEPMRAAILRFSPDVLTVGAFDFVHLCLQARRPRLALPLLDRNIVDVEPGETGGSTMTVLQVQEYYLLGASIYIGVRNYERARQMLDLVLAVPAQQHATDLFMVEAYKKLVLLGLIARGYPYSAAHLVDQASLKTIQLVSKAYLALADAFHNRDLAKFHAELDTAGNLWSDDGNHGLVNETSESLRRYRVIDLQRTYATLPALQIATHLSMSPQATMALLQNMIQQGHLQASISDPTTSSSHLTNGEAASAASPVLRFHAWDAGAVQHTVSESTVQAQIRRIHELQEAVKEADRKLALTKEYNDYIRRSKKSADAGAAAYEDPMDMDGPLSDMPGSFDEDIMAS